MSDFEKAKALLQKKQGSTSVYDHLSEVLLKLVTEDPADSVALFENISALVKKASFPGETTGARAGGKADESESKTASLAWASKASGLFVAPEAADGVTPGAGEGRLLQRPVCVHFPSFLLLVILPLRSALPRACHCVGVALLLFTVCRRAAIPCRCVLEHRCFVRSTA